jgi:hypothetical protein
VPTFSLDPSWPTLPAQLRLGDASSFSVDGQDNVWLLHRPRTLPAEQRQMAAPPVVVFDATGTVVRMWGGEGAGFEWPQREHGIHVDGRGFVWIGGNNCPTNGIAGLQPVNDDQLLKFRTDGTFVRQIGRSHGSRGNADTSSVHRPADAWVHAATNELFVADGYGNHRVIVFDAETGAFKRMWGAFGEPPRDDDHCEVVTPPSVGDPGPRAFSTVHALRVARDGMVYVADREHRRVQQFTSDGRFVRQLVKLDTPFARSLALSPDSSQQFLYVGNTDDIVVVDRQRLAIIGSVRPAGLTGNTHHMATDSRGNLYVAATTSDMQKLIFTGLAPRP